MKRCSGCKKIKDDVEFGKAELLINSARCRPCFAEYYKKNKEEVDKKRRETKQEDIKNINKKYYQKNREKILQKTKEYAQNNKIDRLKKRRVYAKNRRKSDPIYKLRENVSSLIKRLLKSTGGSKEGKSILDYLPYTIQELKQYLEGQFESWMTWENYGIYRVKMWDNNDISTWRWQLDHIIPQSLSPYTSMRDENFQKVWSLSNLRPLSAKQNVMDGNRRIF
jgi:hypothetical protein